MRKLSQEAQQGETAAARELRAWLSQFPPDQDAADLGDLDRVTRQSIAAILARALAEHEEHLQVAPFEAGTQDGFDSPLDQDSVEPVGLPPDDGSHPIDRGSRPLVAELAPDSSQGPVQIESDPYPTPENERVPSPDGTDSRMDTPYGHSGGSIVAKPHQMDVDECIEEAGRG